MYINGLGLEVLKTCKRTFSKLNTLATMTQYASVFHSQQVISMYLHTMMNTKFIPISVHPMKNELR